MESIKDLTIIIATNLKNIKKTTIYQINNYASNGIKIILSIPPESDIIKTFKLGFSEKILIIKSNLTGQVKQRQYAYKFCKTKFIMQMDDDIEFDTKKINTLLLHFKKLPHNSCLAPYLNLKSNSFSRLSNIARNLFLYCDFFPKAGSIARSSFPIPFVKFKNSQTNLYEEVNWLPGGILILRKEDIIKEDYFPFKGKAFCEDLIHSFILKEKGIKLYISNKLFFTTPLESYRNLNLFNFFKLIKNDFLIRNYYRNLVKNKFLPFLIAYLYIFTCFFLTKIKRIFYRK